MNSGIATKYRSTLLLRNRRDPGDQSSQSQDLEGENEGEGKVKTKLLSMWNNMKYGWTVKIKTNFSKDSPVWLLGKCYHRKLQGVIEEPTPHREACVEVEGIEGFKMDFISRIWLTYRREFPNMNGSNFTTDCGWGCMLRSGQMLLAQALVCHFLGRDWRWNYDQKCTTVTLFKEDSSHRKIIKWFGDNPSCNSPLSIHTLVSLGEASGKKAGDWYGPGSVAHLLRQAVELAAKENSEFEELIVYVAQDCAVYIQDILDQCEAPCQIPTNAVRQTIPKPHHLWKSLILLVPVRLGAEKMNSIYGPCLLDLLTLENCIGIIGGRPKHSLYFVGYQDDKLINLDPHYCQEVVDVWQPDFPLYSFHCRSPRKMNLSKMDPSCCIGFYCRTREDFNNFVKNVQPFLIPSHEKAEYPMFVFCEGRARETLAVAPYDIPDDVHKLGDAPFHESDNEFESEEFEIV